MATTHSNGQSQDPPFKQGDHVQHRSGWRGVVIEFDSPRRVFVRCGQMRVECTSGDLRAVSGREWRRTEAKSREEEAAQRDQSRAHFTAEEEAALADELLGELFDEFPQLQGPRAETPVGVPAQSKATEPAPPKPESLSREEFIALLSERSGWVYIDDLDERAHVERRHGADVEVVVGTRRFEVGKGGFTPIADPRGQSRRMTAKNATDEAWVFDGHGMSREEFMRELENEILLAANMGAEEVEVIHGYRHGTVLRDALHSALKVGKLKDHIRDSQYIPERNPGKTRLLLF